MAFFEEYHADLEWMMLMLLGQLSNYLTEVRGCRSMNKLGLGA